MLHGARRVPARPRDCYAMAQSRGKYWLSATPAARDEPCSWRSRITNNVNIGTIVGNVLQSRDWCKGCCAWHGIHGVETDMRRSASSVSIFLKLSPRIRRIEVGGIVWNTFYKGKSGYLPTALVDMNATDTCRTNHHCESHEHEITTNMSNRHCSQPCFGSLAPWGWPRCG